MAKDPAWCLKHGRATLWVLLMAATRGTDTQAWCGLALSPLPSPAGAAASPGIACIHVPMHGCACACLPAWGSSVRTPRVSGAVQWKEPPAPPASGKRISKNYFPKMSAKKLMSFASPSPCQDISPFSGCSRGSRAHRSSAPLHVALPCEVPFARKLGARQGENMRKTRGITRSCSAWGRKDT